MYGGGEPRGDLVAEFIRRLPCASNAICVGAGSTLQSFGEGSKQRVNMAQRHGSPPVQLSIPDPVLNPLRRGHSPEPVPARRLRHPGSAWPGRGRLCPPGGPPARWPFLAPRLCAHRWRAYVSNQFCRLGFNDPRPVAVSGHPADVPHRPEPSSDGDRTKPAKGAALAGADPRPLWQGFPCPFPVVDGAGRAVPIQLPIVRLSGNT